MSMLSIVFTVFTWKQCGFEEHLVMVLVNLAGVYGVFDTIKRYSKIKLDKNEVTIRQFLTSNTYSFNTLISWKELVKGAYSSRFDRLFLEFENESFTLSDISDPKGFEDLFHFLRVNFPELNQNIKSDSNIT